MLAKKYCHLTYIYRRQNPSEKEDRNTHTHTHTFSTMPFHDSFVKKTNFYNLIYDRIGKKGLCKIHG